MKKKNNLTTITIYQTNKSKCQPPRIRIKNFFSRTYFLRTEKHKCQSHHKSFEGPNKTSKSRLGLGFYESLLQLSLFGDKIKNGADRQTEGNMGRT